jgi:hypothetical protein
VCAHSVALQLLAAKVQRAVAVVHAHLKQATGTVSSTQTFYDDIEVTIKAAYGALRQTTNATTAMQAAERVHCICDAAHATSPDQCLTRT